MRRTPSLSSPTRRLGATAAALLLGAVLVGCGEEDGSDPAPEAATESSAETSEDLGEESDEESGGESGAGDLPAWAPQIETEGDDVVGLDFSDVEPASDELLVEVVEEGDGPAVEAGQEIQADYFGQLADADAPFDESFSGSPFTAPIGVGSLIAGWDQGLVGVPVGSRVVMSIPSDLGYGDAGSPPAIPGGATLYFVIDIIDAQ